MRTGSQSFYDCTLAPRSDFMAKGKNDARTPSSSNGKKGKKTPGYLANVDKIAAQAPTSGKGRGGQNWGGARAGR